MRHRLAHAVRPALSDVGVALALLGVIAGLHTIGTSLADHWLRSALLRLYYIPILYMAFRGGLLAGIAAGGLAASTHYAIMVWATPALYAGEAVHAEHLAELVVFVLAAAVVGGLRDHERYERHRNTELSDLFGSYVSPVVLEKIVRREVPLDGASTEACILFSDLRGFTAMAENMNPKDVLRLLNSYFAQMIDVLVDQGAYIDKFIGDGIMAVFGVPLPQPDPPLRAVRAAIAMHHRTMAMNREGAFGNRALDTGVGIHLGEVVAGNVGGPSRREYTVIGDTVNSAARLESLNRLYGSHVLVSETVADAVRSMPELLMREVDAVRLKGRVRPTVIYEVYNCCSDSEIRQKSDTIHEFTSGLRLYRQQEWDLALDAFRGVLARYPKDPLSRVYCNRIQELRAACPEDWDGVYNFTMSRAMGEGSHEGTTPGAHL